MAGFQYLPARFSAGKLSARLVLSAVGPWLVSPLPESCVLFLGGFFLVVRLVFRWACNLAAPGLNALGATIVCSDSWYGIAPPLKWGGIWATGGIPGEDEGLVTSGPSLSPFRGERGVLLGFSASLPGLWPFVNPGGAISILFANLVHTLSCCSGALSRFFHAASRFELHLNCPLAGGKFVRPHRCGEVCFSWVLVYFVSVDTTLRFIYNSRIPWRTK